MAISIGDAVLKVGVDTKALDRGMKGIGASIKKHQKAIGIGMTAMGGAILAAGVLSIKTFAEMGDEVQKMALRTGFSTEALSELRHAAEISGASLSTLEKGVKRMSGTILDAQDGLETYIRAFQHIGIEVKELDGLNPEEQFLKIAEAIAEVEDPTKRAAIAQDIFGRAGTELLPLFAAGKEGLAALREEAHQLGIVFDQEAANKAAEFNDAMTRMKESVSGVQMAIATQIIPILLPLIDRIRDIISGVSAWMKEHSRLTDIIIKFIGIMAGLMVVGGPLLIFAPTIGKIVTAARALVNFFITRLIPTIVAVIVALWAKVAALLAVMAAMGPAGWAMMVVAFAAIGTAAYAAFKGVESAIQGVTSAQEVMNSETRIAQQETDALASANRELGTSIDETTESLEKEAAAIKAVIDASERMYQALAPPGVVREAFVSPEHRAAVRAEAEMWGKRAREASSAGKPEEAAHAARQAAAMQSRLLGMQYGGIAMRPMVASIAEKQPEAVIPLDRLTRIIGNKIVNIFVELDGRVIGRAVGQPLVDEIRLKTGVRM